MTALTTPIIGKGYKADIDVTMSYYPQEYAGPDYKPFFVSYWDYSNDDEEIITGTYYGRQEARTAYDNLIKTATEYAKSLLNTVYSFTEYLEII